MKNITAKQPSKGGRKPLPTAEKRSHCVSVKYNKTEYYVASEKARKVGLPLASYIRDSSVYCELKARVPDDVRRLLKSYMSEFHHMGININIIAKNIRDVQVRDIVSDLTEDIKSLRRFLSKL